MLKSLKQVGTAFLSRRRTKELHELIVNRSFFDSAYYAANYGISVHGLEHFLNYGLVRGYCPNPNWDPLLYAIHTGSNNLHGIAIEYLKSRPAGSECAFSSTNALNYFAASDSGLWGAGKSSEDLQKVNEQTREQYKKFRNPSRLVLNYGREHFEFLAPTPDSLFEKLENHEPVALVRLPHGFWDSITFVEAVFNKLQSDRRLSGFSAENRFRLATRLAFAQFPRKGGLAENFLSEIVAELSDPKNRANLLCGVSFKGYPTIDERLFIRKDELFSEQQSRILDSFVKFFSSEETLYDGVNSKRWCLTGTIRVLPELLVSRPVVLIAPPIFKGLGERWGLKYFDHLGIPPFNAHLNRYSLLRHCERLFEQHLQSVQSSTPPVLLTQCGGSLAFWLICKLQRKFPEASFLDFGQALSIWYLDEEDILKPDRGNKRRVVVPWLREYGQLIIRNCGLGKYYDVMGMPDFDKNLISE